MKGGTGTEEELYRVLFKMPGLCFVGLVAVVNDSVLFVILLFFHANFNNSV